MYFSGLMFLFLGFILSCTQCYQFYVKDFSDITMLFMVLMTVGSILYAFVLFNDKDKAKIPAALSSLFSVILISIISIYIINGNNNVVSVEYFAMFGYASAFGVYSLIGFNI